MHAQLERGIRSAIAAGRLKAGDQLPTVRQLAVDLRVNANTVAKVYAHLERSGVLETRRGVGTFNSDVYGKVCINVTTALSDGTHTLAGKELRPNAVYDVAPG